MFDHTFGVRKDTERKIIITMNSSGRKSSKENSDCKLPSKRKIWDSKKVDTASHFHCPNPGRYILHVEDLKSNLHAFITGLKLRSKDNNFELSYSEREDLYVLLVHHINKNMKPSHFVSTILYLSHLKHNSRSWECTRELALLSERMPLGGSYNNTFAAKDISIIFTSYAKMQARYDRTLKDRDYLLSLTASYMCHLNDRSVGDIIWSLGSMNASWEMLPLNLRQEIMTAISKHVSSFSSYTLSSVLWAMSKMGIKWSCFPSDVRMRFVAKLQEFVREMSPQQSSKVIWALGNFGASYDEFSDGVLSSLLENVNRIKKSQMGSAVPASQALMGIAKTGIHWSSLDQSTRNIILEQAERIIQSNNARGIANALWALGSLGSLSTEHPKMLREALCDGCTKVACSCSSWGFCNMIWGFAKMGYVWSDFPPNFRESIAENIGRIEIEMNAIDVSILTWSLGSLAVPLNSSPRPEKSGTGRKGVDGRILGPLFDAIIRTLPEMKSQEVSSLIWGLSGTGIAWDSLPQALRWSVNVALRRVGETMSPQDVANCAYGLTLLTFDTENPLDPGFRGAHDALINKLQAMSKLPTSSNVELEQLRIFAHFYETLKIGASSDVIRGARVPRVFLEFESLEGSYLSREMRGSNLQHRVIEGLQSALNALEKDKNPYVKDIYIDVEVSSFGGILPVDALICINNKFKVNKNEVLAILEIDGPQHYRDDGALRRVDLLKEFMYLKRHPEAIFCRIRWDEANKIGVRVIGESLAEQILQTAESNKNPFSGINKLVGNFVEKTKKAISNSFLVTDF